MRCEPDSHAFMALLDESIVFKIHSRRGYIVALFSVKIRCSTCVCLKEDCFNEMLLSALLQKQQIINLVWVSHFCSLYQYKVKGLGSFKWKWLFSAIYFSFVLCILVVVLGNRKYLLCENEEQTPDESTICVDHWLSLSASWCGAAEPDSCLSESKAGCGPICTGTNQQRVGHSRVPLCSPWLLSHPSNPLQHPLSSAVWYQSAGHCQWHQGQPSLAQIPIFSWKFLSFVRSLSSSEHPCSLRAFSNHISKN